MHWGKTILASPWHCPGISNHRQLRWHIGVLRNDFPQPITTDGLDLTEFFRHLVQASAVLLQQIPSCHEALVRDGFDGT